MPALSYQEWNESLSEVENLSETLANLSAPGYQSLMPYPTPVKPRLVGVELECTNLSYSTATEVFDSVGVKTNRRNGRGWRSVSDSSIPSAKSCSCQDNEGCVCGEEQDENCECECTCLDEGDLPEWQESLAPVAVSITLLASISPFTFCGFLVPNAFYYPGSRFRHWDSYFREFCAGVSCADRQALGLFDDGRTCRVCSEGCQGSSGCQESRSCPCLNGNCNCDRTPTAEVVSPPFRSQKAFQALEDIAFGLFESGAHAATEDGSDCCTGLHVHIDSRDLSMQEALQIRSAFLRDLDKFQEVHPTILPEFRRDCYWARESETGTDKYRACNLLPLSRYGTIEFRSGYLGTLAEDPSNARQAAKAIRSYVEDLRTWFEGVLGEIREKVGHTPKPFGAPIRDRWNLRRECVPSERLTTEQERFYGYGYTRTVWQDTVRVERVINPSPAGLLSSDEVHAALADYSRGLNELSLADL